MLVHNISTKLASPTQTAFVVFTKKYRKMKVMEVNDQQRTGLLPGCSPGTAWCLMNELCTSVEWNYSKNYMESTGAPPLPRYDPVSLDTFDNEDDSDWSDDEDEEALDEGLVAVNSELWQSFLHCDDPYNPLSFSSPIGSKDNDKQTAVERQTDTPPEWPHKTERQLTASTAEQKDRTKGSKQVRFNHVVKVHPLVTWKFASRAARDGSCWMEMARDRARFSRRIQAVGSAIQSCLQTEHRAEVWQKIQKLSH